MPLELGAAFRPKPPVEVFEPEVHQPTVDDLRAEQLLVALEALKDALFSMPAPVVHVSEPDLSAIVTAVTALKGPATPEDIARAVVNEITPGGEPGMDQVMGKLVESLDRLDYRMKGLAGSTGGGGVGVSDINDRDTRALGVVSNPTSAALLTTVRDTVLRRTDPIASGSNFTGFTGDTEGAATEQGRFRWSGGKATTSAVSPNASCTVTNPATSGVDIVLTRYQVEVDAAADIRIIYDAVSTGALRVLTNPNRRVEVANPAEVRVGSGVTTGGTMQDYIRMAGPNVPVAVGSFWHRISPGKSWTVQFVGPGATNNVWFVVGLLVVPAAGGLL